MKNITFMIVAAATVFLGSAAYAASRTENVCWRSPKDGCTASNVKPSDFPTVTQSYECGSGGNSGYNPDWVCRQLCGQPQGPHCGTYTKDSWGWAGGRCGTRYTIVSCY